MGVGLGARLHGEHAVVRDVTGALRDVAQILFAVQAVLRPQRLLAGVQLRRYLPCARRVCVVLRSRQLHTPHASSAQ